MHRRRIFIIGIIAVVALAAVAGIWWHDGFMVRNVPSSAQTQAQEKVHVPAQPYHDMIALSEPVADEEIRSPLMIHGTARGNWYFEGSFPVVLVDWDGRIIAEGVATAQGEWMTTEFVPYTATLTFARPSYGTRGALILRKDNPSGLSEHDDALEVPVVFGK